MKRILNELRKALIVALGGYTEPFHPDGLKVIYGDPDRKPTFIRAEHNGIYWHPWDQQMSISELKHRICVTLEKQPDLFLTEEKGGRRRVTLCIWPPVEYKMDDAFPEGVSHNA